MVKARDKTSPIRKKARLASSNIRSSKHTSKQLPVSDCEEEEDTADGTNLSIAFDDHPTSTVPKSSEDVMPNRSSNDLVHSSSNGMETDDGDNSDYLLRKINQLSLKLSEKSQLLKERDAEIKRLRSTSISEFHF